MRYFELVIVLAACLTPQFLLANEVGPDEFVKSTSGIALAGIIVGAYRVWQTRSPKEPIDV